MLRGTIAGLTALPLAIAAGAAPLSAQTSDPGLSIVSSGEQAGPSGTMAPGASCIDDSAAPAGVRYFDRLYEPLGTPEPILLENLLRVGEHEGVPLYVGRLATRPYVDLWLPTCHPPGLYRLYTLEHQVGR